MKINIGPYRKNRAFHIRIDDYDVWNLDDTLAHIIHPALIRLRETKQGYPELWEDGMEPKFSNQLAFDFVDFDEQDKYLEKKWNNVMSTMIRAFGLIIHREAHEDAANKSDKGYLKYMLEYYKAVDKGLTLFARHYHALWD